MEISIIMPVYNETVLLERSICSVISQSFTDWELIIIDDGSTDDIGQYCEEYLKSDSRIHLYRQKHRGQSAARNYGLSLAQGRYVAFADADDYMHPQMLEQLHHDIAKNGVKIAISAFRRVNKMVSVREYKRKTTEIWDFSGDSADLNAAVRKDDVYVWNKLYDKLLFEGINFREGRFYEDTVIMLYLFHKAGRVSYNPNILYFYYVNPKGTIHTYSEKKIGDCLWAYEERIRYYYNKMYHTDLEHATHTFLYMAYELYSDAALHCGEHTEKIRRKIRKRVKNVFSRYGLVNCLPFHGRIRYKMFLFYPALFEAELVFRRFRKNFCSGFILGHDKGTDDLCL